MAIKVHGEVLPNQEEVLEALKLLQKMIWKLEKEVAEMRANEARYQAIWGRIEGFELT